MTDGKPYRQLVTLETMLAAVVGLAVGFVLLYVGGRDDWMNTRHGLQSVLNNLGGLLIVSVALGALWELYGKRAFAREILDTARTTTDVDAAGLIRVGTNYLEIDWERLFAGVVKLDIFFAYARTWRNSNHTRIVELAGRRDARIRVYLPDPDHADTVRRLAERFSMTEQSLKSAIQEARDYFVSLGREARASIEVYYRGGDSTFSCYRFDKTAVLTMYTHSQRRTPVPTIVCREGGSLYEFVRAEFRAIHEQSTRT
jgi:hypothetical protein